MLVLETSIRWQSYTSHQKGVGLTPEPPVPIPLPTTWLQAQRNHRRRELRVPKPLSWGLWAEVPGASEDTVPALVVKQGWKRLMVSVQGLAVFSAPLWPMISRVQSHPPAAPAAPCSSAAATGSQRVPEKRGSSPSPVFSQGSKLLPLPETSLKHKTDRFQWQRVQGNE